jgi:hypothetical protein
MGDVIRPLVLLAALGTASVVRPDAAVFTRAMTASTIAEVFVEEEHVRVEIEIGAADLEVFANLLPDELRERMGLAAEPLEARLRRFFAEDWTVTAEGGAPLPGFVTALEGRRRLVRDEITGEPLPNQPTDAEVVVHAELVFPLEGRPAALALKPPAGRAAGAAAGPSANVGFVLYHDGVAVNDFRYLAQEETVVLDWEDPWYSKFQNRNLWRQYEAPLSAYLYVEPFEVRKEVVLRPRDLQRFVDLGLEGRKVIRAEEWGTLKQAVVDYLIGRAPVRIDGRTVEPVLDRVHFIERTLRTSRVIEEPRDLRAVSATLGVIFAYPIDGLPEEATMEWDLFPERTERIPCSAVDEAGGLPGYLTRDDAVLRWENFLLKPTRARLVELDPPPTREGLSLPVASLACALIAAVGVFVTRRPAGRLVVALLAVAALSLWPFARVEAHNPFGGEAVLDEAQAASVSGDLLRNVYRAFDYREESAIYDVLARSTGGELLTDVYLETRRALELENQGGARARIQEVEVLETDTNPVDGGPGFRTRCTWNVAGSVGHWGHLHQRRNQYRAELTVQPVEGEWKITGLELQSEVRL